MVKKRLDDVVRRRVQAGRLLLDGNTPAQTAKAVGVARQTAYVWKAVLSQGGIDALRAMPAPGRPPWLDAEQLQALGVRCWTNPPRMALAPNCGSSSAWVC